MIWAEFFRRLLGGPEDEFDDGVNGDPDSLVGEDEADDEFDEFSGEEWEDGDEDEEEEEDEDDDDWRVFRESGED